MTDVLPALAEYGVAIFSVGVSLTVVWLLLSKFMKHSESQSEAFTTTVKDLADRHERERERWTDVETQRMSKTDDVLSELKDAIRESIRNNKG